MEQGTNTAQRRSTIIITIMTMRMITTIATMTTSTNGSTRLVRLLQLASPTLPVGAYSYSQGLEAAIDARRERCCQRRTVDRRCDGIFDRAAGSASPFSLDQESHGDGIAERAVSRQSRDRRVAR